MKEERRNKRKRIGHTSASGTFAGTWGTYVTAIPESIFVIHGVTNTSQNLAARARDLWPERRRVVGCAFSIDH